ncbi:MAG TPA: formylmethanofuran dehydrogenase subunit E family protein [Bryobacteraceae bacterium]|nr:formylmethanofuran dehydrogenase subunit E family protein [Bryobacteraceae bacterium]
MLAKTAVVTFSMLSLVAFAQHPAETAVSDSEVLARVAEFHGAAGVWAVAGYRIGSRALKELAEKRGSFSLDVTHKTPLEVQWSCIADGVQAATGVSAGKLNLHIVEVTKDQLQTVVWDRKTGKVLLFRIQPGFLAKYLDIPEDRQPAAAHEVLKLSDNSIFTVVEQSRKP